MGRGSAFANRGQMPSDLKTADKEIMGLFDSLSGERLVALADLVISDEVQVRVGGLDMENLARLQAVVENGGELPPIVVYDTDQGLVVADGFHRAEIARRLGLAQIMAEVRKGSYEDALNYAEDANLKHGKMLSAADKRNLLYRRMARGHEWASTSNRAIAKVLGVDHKTISNWINVYNSTGENSPVERSHTIGADGKTRNTSGIQKANQEREKPIHPERPISLAAEKRQKDFVLRELESLDARILQEEVKPAPDADRLAVLKARKEKLERDGTWADPRTPPPAPPLEGEGSDEAVFVDDPEAPDSITGFAEAIYQIGQLRRCQTDFVEVLETYQFTEQEQAQIKKAFNEHVNDCGQILVQMKRQWG